MSGFLFINNQLSIIDCPFKLAAPTLYLLHGKYSKQKQINCRTPLYR